MGDETASLEHTYQQQVLRYEYVLEALSDIGEELCRVTSFDAQLKSLLHLLLGTLGVRKGGIFLFEPLASRLVMRCSWKLAVSASEFCVPQNQVETLEQLTGSLTFTASEFPFIPEFVQAFSEEGLSSISVLKVREKFIGLLVVGHKLKKTPLSEKERSFLTTLSRNIAVAINNFFLLSKLREANTHLDEKIQEVSILYQATQMISRELQTQSLLDMAMNATSDISEVQRGSIWLFDEDQDMFLLRSHLGSGDNLPEKVLPTDSDILTRLLQTKEPLIRLCAEADQPLGNRLDENLFGRTFILVPIVHLGEFLGVMHLCEKISQDDFTERDQRLIKVFAVQLGAAVKNAKLYEQAITDGMTHLYLHRYFKQRLFDELKRAARFKRYLSLIMIDIDYFKKFNDTFGHQAGDEVLRRVASILRKAIRTHDLPVRYGGEEFALVLPETDLVGAVAVAERVRRNIEIEHLEFDGKVIKITASFGVAVFPGSAEEMEPLIKAADNALYSSKENGRNRVTVAPNVAEPSRTQGFGPILGDPESVR